MQNGAVTLSETKRHPDFGAGFWRLADPKISLASFASMFLGACLAAGSRPLDWGWLLLTVAGVFAIEVAKNASGEIVDFDSGTDLGVTPEHRSPFSGGKRVLVDGVLTRRQTLGIAVAGYAAGLAVAVWIAVARALWLLALAGASVAIAYFYHASPLRLSYRGWGEAAVAVTYGPLLCAGVYLVQTRPVPFEVLWLGTAVGLLIGAFLWINEFPDAEADRAAGKRTLVVRLGVRRAVHGYCVIVAAAYLMLILTPAVTPSSPAVWLGGVAIPCSAFACKRLAAAPEETARIVPAQAASLFAFVLFALGTGLGALLA